MCLHEGRLRLWPQKLPKKTTSGVLYAIKFVERARKRANEETVLFVSAGSYHCRGITTSKIPLFDPTFEESQPSAAGHFGEFKQIA